MLTCFGESWYRSTTSQNQWNINEKSMENQGKSSTIMKIRTILRHFWSKNSIVAWIHQMTSSIDFRHPVNNYIHFWVEIKCLGIILQRFWASFDVIWPRSNVARDTLKIEVAGMHCMGGDWGSSAGFGTVMLWLWLLLPILYYTLYSTLLAVV